MLLLAFGPRSWQQSDLIRNRGFLLVSNGSYLVAGILTAKLGS